MSTNAAFLFLKPHVADNKNVRELVQDELKKRSIKVIAEGEILSEKIDREQLIDKHYYAIASKAVLLKPHQLNVPTDQFENKFQISWTEALEKGLCLNAKDACEKWNLNALGLEKKWREAKRLDRVIKFGGGFYCSEIDGHFVFNGFFMSMRDNYVAPGRMIYYFKVEWSPNELSWKEFRLRVLGATDPAEAHKESIRGRIFADWKNLGLSAEPDMGKNGLHGSASAFEGLIERMNWCGDDLEKDPFGRTMLDAGVTADNIRRWKEDPQIVIDAPRKMGGIFDALEDTDSRPCVEICLRVQKLNDSVDDSSNLMRTSTMIITIAFVSIGAYMLYSLRKSKDSSSK